MKKLLLILTLLTVFDARADWVLIYANNEFQSYLDFSSSESDGQYLRVWHLLNFKDPQVVANKLNQSVEILWEMDCLANRSRNLSSIWHAGEMGEGFINYSDSFSTEWKINITHTLSHHLWLLMCSAIFI